MTLQFWFILPLAALATLYLARGLFKSACGSGCGACQSKGCPSRKLAAARVERRKP